MIKINLKQKALYRIGQKVASLYYAGRTFKVYRKEWDHYGTVRYTLFDTAFSNTESRFIGGVREKDMISAK